MTLARLVVFLPLVFSAGLVAAQAVDEAAATAPATPAPLDPEKAIPSALAAAQKGDLAAARTNLRASLAAKPRCETCLYDLGVIEQRDGHNGAALAYWRRAAALDSSYEAPRRAIRFTIPKLERQEIAHEYDAWEHLREAALEPVGTWSYGFIALLFMLGAAWKAINWVAARRKAEEADETPSGPWLTGAACALAFTIALLLQAAKLADIASTRATVVAKNVSAQSAPDLGSAPLFELFEGLEVIVRQSRGDWIQVAYPASLLGGSTGWVRRDSIITDAADGGST